MQALNSAIRFGACKMQRLNQAFSLVLIMTICTQRTRLVTHVCEMYTQLVTWKFIPFSSFFFRGMTNPPFLDNAANGRCFPAWFGRQLPYEFKYTANGVSSFISELEPSGANPPILDQCFDANVWLQPLRSKHFPQIAAGQLTCLKLCSSWLLYGANDNCSPCRVEWDDAEASKFTKTTLIPFVLQL